jgi:membrane protein implicated in regulation of membrane protease activity
LRRHEPVQGYGCSLELNLLIFPVSSSGLERHIRVGIKRPDVASQRSETDDLSSDRGVRRWAVGLASLFFIALQSACTLVMALSGVRLVIGLGALAAVATGAKGPAIGLHQDAIRIPMMALAVLGSCINLYMVWRIRSLRRRPSSRWRQQPISSRRLWGERVQITLAVVTLVLVFAEFLSHHYIFRLVG